MNGTFPADEDIFRLVSIAKNGKSVKIGVVGGSYDSGAATATLKLGEKLTLVNTADGTRYVIAAEGEVRRRDLAGLAARRSTTPTSTVAPPTTTTHGDDADRHRLARHDARRRLNHPVSETFGLRDSKRSL